MQRLVLINGVPASGKSTLAHEWCERHAVELPLCLDIDAIRYMIGGWRDHRTEAGLAARDVAIAAITAHLGSGRDVLVPQYLKTETLIQRLEDVAASAGASFVETALLIDAATATRRFEERARLTGVAEPWGALQTDMESITRRFDDFLTTRANVVRIHASATALRELDGAISG